MGDSKEQAKAKAESDLWRTSFKRVLLWSMRRHRLNPADAEEIVQEAIRQFVASGGVADPSDPNALLWALRSKVNGIAINRRRKKADKVVTLTTDGAPAEPDDPPPDPNEAVVAKDLARRAISALLDRVQADELVLAVVMQMAAGVQTPAEQAKALGKGVTEVYKARVRLNTHKAAIKKLMETW